jgi:hypothetical protein
MAKLRRHHSNLVLSLSLALLPWLGCSPSESTPTDLDGGTTGTAGTHAGGSTGAAGHAGAGGSTGTGTGGSIGGQAPGGSGTAGTTGSAGTTGAGGHAGSAGTRTTGAAGAPATSGAAGAPATTGAAGAPATTGAAGAPATTGAAGAPPTSGAAGAPATTGAAGAPATTGAAGSGVVTTGAAGTTGTTGAGGHAGSAGTSTTGAAGAPATTGAAGAPATTGSAGAPATTGAAGATGVTGTAGTTGTTGTGTAGATGAGGTTTAGNTIKNVFVIAMENEPASAIYGDKNAPYLNGLIAKYAHATAFTDPLPDSIPSEPHYVWMEAGTNKFSDATFTDDSDPDASNSTKSTAHLTTQMMAANPPVSWMGVMEGLGSGSGACPVSSSGFYVAKHDPFIFFQDIAGGPPSKSNALCSAHHKAFTSGQALVQGTVAQYNFISPTVCNDMHGDPACPSGDPIAMGDAWLAANLPPLIDYVNANSGVIFIVWDEPEGGSPVMPFFAIGPHIKPGYTSTVAYTHSSLVKTVEEIFHLPLLPTVAGAPDFADLFQPGMFP